LAVNLVRFLCERDLQAYVDADNQLAKTLQGRGLDDAAVLLVGGLLIHEAAARLARANGTSTDEFLQRLRATRNDLPSMLLKRVFFI
jgi:hypothetical protein